MTEELGNFSELNLPKVEEGKKPKFSLGVADPKIGSHIFEETRIPCHGNEFILELLRGVRFHFDAFVSDFDLPRLGGLGHSYVRAKERFNVNLQVDNVVIQAIFGLDTLDKDVNSSSMRLRMWYSWNFPELFDIVNDNYLYAKVVKYIENKFELSEDKMPGLIEILGDDEDKAKEIVEAAKSSTWKDFSPIYLVYVKHFSQRVMNLAQYRKNVHEYLVNKMNDIASGLAFVIGEVAPVLCCH
ncbi:hypothetical protein MKX01_015833 [Papaver californicum]|nr:hypothetical protein MKX01_015833 [Papaver californicum]